ncbi:MAG: class I SAM-dependent methyltransferase [Opitutaceae bacterium]
MSADASESRRVPRGNTCEGVNAGILAHLATLPADWNGARFLDLPCGRGEFMAAVRETYPGAEVKGADLAADDGRPDLRKTDLSQPFRVFPEITFDVVTSISGVMEFDNTLQFIRSCREHLRSDGLLIITNDNILTTRDRLSFLLLGRVRRFKLYSAPGEPTWKMVSIPNLVRGLEDGGFAIEKIFYTSARPKEWLFLPVALLLWLPLWLHLRREENLRRNAILAQMYPFRSLVCRHYVVVARKVSNPRRADLPTSVNS